METMFLTTELRNDQHNRWYHRVGDTDLSKNVDGSGIEIMIGNHHDCMVF